MNYSVLNYNLPSRILSSRTVSVKFSSFSNFSFILAKNNGYVGCIHNIVYVVEPRINDIFII